MESDQQKKQPPCPRVKANYISVLFFWWVNSFMSLGNSREINVEDLYACVPGDDSEELGLKLQREWSKEIEKYSGGERNEAPKTMSGRPSLTKALIRTFGLQFLRVGFLAFVEECVFRIGQPLCLGRLISYFDEGSTMPASHAYLYATGVVLGSALYTFTHHPYFFACQHTGMHLRVSSCSLIFRKCLLLSQKAIGQTTIGQMVNLMSNDVNRFDFSVIFLHYLWVGPLQSLITTVILWLVLGPSCLVGLAVLIFFVPFQSWMGKLFSRFRMQTAKRTDERIRTMNEMISGMRVIKMYSWEKPFAKLVELCRRNEVDIIRRTNHFRALNMSLFFTSSKLIIFLTFIVYVLTGNALTADKVFLTVALFNNIRLIMTLFFPSAITMAAEASISIKRIEDFLLLDEITTESGRLVRPALSECFVDVSGVTVKWPAAGDGEDNTLQDVSFCVRPGQILAVIGQVGSGKSSLLHVILGELSPLSGDFRIAGKVAYACQEPWIFSGTIRQNILCGLAYDPERYKKVVKACALVRDFNLLSSGDLTLVGERGVSLSGGQKARVNLARALYVDADIYLLDDPLSAVDTHVGRHLFDECIKSLLAEKICILVTHQTQYLNDVNEILVLRGGRVEVKGTYQEIMKSGVNVDRASDSDSERTGETIKLLDEIEPDGSFGQSGSTSSTRTSMRHRGSHSSKSSTNDRDERKPTMAEESRSTGKVTFAVYWLYLRSGAGHASLTLLGCTCVLTQVLFSGSDYWLNLWTNAENIRSQNQTSTTATPITSTVQSFNSQSGQLLIAPDAGSPNETSFNGRWLEDMDTFTGIYVYSALIAGVFVFSMIRTVHFFVMCMNSSISLHNQTLNAVVRTPLAFFDRNPVGRILNRFSKDIGCIDEVLPSAFFDVISIGLTALGILVVVGLVNLWLILPIFFLAVVFYKLRQFYLETARNVKRLEATTRSPVFTHLSSSLVGLATVRAHQLEVTFQRIFDKHQDVHSSAWYMFLSTTRWFGIWLDWICVSYVTCVTYSCVALRDVISSSEAGLAISSAMALTGMFQWGVRQSAEVENQMTSVERVLEYSKLTPEAPLETGPDERPPPTWPQEGTIRFDRMSLKYNEADSPVLKNVTCLVNAQEKVGIVGRTGAGKSSLIASLFRLTEPDGRIIIDGIDIKSLGLHDLRSKISIIPQDPVLFSGSLRRNLDPFGDHSDEVLWNALGAVKLKDTIMELPAGLDSVMTEGGSNLSVGQRQLVCLARAVLRRNRILVLDEATANVDPKTDELIQITIRERFNDCTVLTIAHRLNTIMDSDRVMVMDAGSLREFEHPAVLLENPKSVFYIMVEQTGPVAAAKLKELAKQAAEHRRQRTECPTMAVANLQRPFDPCQYSEVQRAKDIGAENQTGHI